MDRDGIVWEPGDLGITADGVIFKVDDDRVAYCTVFGNDETFGPYQESLHRKWGFRPFKKVRLT